MRRVAIIGVGMSKFGEVWERGFRELVAEAGLRAIEDAKVQGEEIDALFGGTMAAGRLIGQEHIAALIADYMGINPTAATRVEDACASGGVALRTGMMAVASGLHDMVVVGGVEKMTDVAVGDATSALGGAGDQEWELFMGATFPSLYAFIAQRHMKDYGTTEEQMAAVAVKNHANASKNKYAQYQNEITIEQVMKSKVIASPLKLFDCSPITDGAAAVVLCPLDKAKKYTDTPIEIIGTGQASDTIALHSRESFTTLKATKIAAKKAYDMAKVGPKDIKVAEVHDCFTIAELLAIEDLGFFKKGEGGKATANGETALNSKISINTSGGLKGCGHPVGATGVKQAVEIAWQLRGDAGARQVSGAEYGLTQNVGGSGATAVVHIYKRAD
ncbi:3-ketoacyl-CoA thiolase [Candidatus Gugararchaeum adminiculabundum]|nr:3-ketoacyl-CoA thiolase [Candidatus Gugararchaeum adminiculabundum]